MNLKELKEPELQDKLKSAKTVDELVALAEEAGVELTNEQLATFSGSEEWYEPIPPCRSAGPCTTFGR